ncbi:MAG: OmpA family protein [Sandaracinaceae bacterium]|nr:OmpA family protein [Sandaracinaceae bacterium]
MNTVRILVVITLALAFTAGCNDDDDARADDTSGGESGDAQTGPTPTSVQRHVDLTPANGGGGGGHCSLSTIYFTYDAAELDAASRAAIQEAVECFRTQGAPTRLHLTGATDPRGTEEYNVALGERRAQAVSRYLTSLGVDAGRVAVHSMGEEAAEGTDEQGWARDRNVTAATED